MNRKQKLIISITGITIVLLALLGLTYGYYLTRIQGNTNSNSISITTADLTLTYRDGTGELIANNIMPGDEITSKTFTVKNEGQDVESYTVALINIMNNFTFKDDLEVSVSCSSNINSGVCEGFAEDYEDNIYKEKYPAVNSELFSLGIKEGETHTFTLTVDYLYQDFDQSDDMGKTLKGKVQIYDPKDTIEVSGGVTGYTEGDYAEIHSDVQTSEIVDGVYKFIGIPADNHTVYIKNRNTNTEKSTTVEIKKGTEEGITNNVITFTDTSKVASITIDASNTDLSATANDVHNGALKKIIMTDPRITKNTNVPDFSAIADYKITGDSSSGEIGMYSAEDDYGTSWYLRGAQSYNYVNFAGFTWRIVRINGDNTIRLILDGALDTVDTCDDSNSSVKFCSKSVFDNNNTTSALYGNAGYMYGTYLDDSGEILKDYTSQNQNINDSILKKSVDAFYETHILSYQSYIADTMFCGDKTIISSRILDEPVPPGETTQSYIVHVNYYNKERISNSNPSLKCANINDENHTEEQKAYSRYTSKIETGTTTSKGVLVNNDLKYPIALLTTDEMMMAGNLVDVSNTNSYLYKENLDWWTINTFNKYSHSSTQFYSMSEGKIKTEITITSLNSIRPVINLKSNVLVNTGNGTVNSPYTIKLPS